MQKSLLSVPQNLIRDVKKTSGAPTKSRAVIIAMEEYLRDKKLNRLLQRMGKGFGISLRGLLESRQKS